MQGKSPRLALPGQEGAVHGGRVLLGGRLARKEQATAHLLPTTHLSSSTFMLLTTSKYPSCNHTSACLVAAYLQGTHTTSSTAGPCLKAGQITGQRRMPAPR
jgi:hypothetical protein